MVSEKKKHFLIINITATSQKQHTSIANLFFFVSLPQGSRLSINFRIKLLIFFHHLHTSVVGLHCSLEIFVSNEI